MLFKRVGIPYYMYASKNVWLEHLRLSFPTTCMPVKGMAGTSKAGIPYHMYASNKYYWNIWGWQHQITFYTFYNPPLLREPAIPYATFRSYWYLFILLPRVYYDSFTVNGNSISLILFLRMASNPIIWMNIRTKPN